ncbi:hypothetical protein N7471_012445 [Penicillium samsonianum]|uniref:uncharacterized protein n=1 Tax=Penicillium samsonianum TaxID=1882272 RepID=UPI002547C213|nr:uncharacterized protein N7471_012445 [Penicillium samsonianum]KAJ6125128.1 hypothetical protein N7471_012445 [Penicillium samsonianum]
MSPTGNKIPINSSSPAHHPSRSYKEASTSRWQLQALFQSFLENRPVDTMLAVQERRLLVSWDLKAIHYLRRCLRTWILDKVPGVAIGAFLVTVLYEQDFHLDYRLTMMVRDGQTQLHIARRLLAFYQIRDEAGAPIWDNVTVYDEDAHPKLPATQRKSTAGSSAATKELPPRIPTPPPADPRWPLFMGALSDPEIEDLMDKLGDDDQRVGEDLPPLFTGVREEDIPIIQAFRRFNLHKNDSSEDIPLPESGTDRIAYTSKQTNISQDKPLPSLPIKKPLPALPTDKALPDKSLLPLPPLSRPSSPNPSSVRVSTFKSGKKLKVRWADCVPSKHANIEQGTDKADLRSSAAARPKLPVNVDVNQHTPRPSDTIYAYVHYNVPPTPPKLKKKAGVDDLRKARECGG